MDHRRSLRHLLASRPHRHPLAPARLARGRRWPVRRIAELAVPTARSRAAVARAGQQRPAAVRLRPPLGVAAVAGADEAGRGCLAGPLVAAAVLFDYEALTTRELRALSALNDSKQHTTRGARGALPAAFCAAPRASSSSRAACAASTRAGCTRRISRRCATRCEASLRDVSGEVLCLMRRLRGAEFGARSARSSTATRPAPRSRPRRSSRR